MKHSHTFTDKEREGYRLYSLNDLWRLNVIRDLRSLGFSMEQIKEYLNNRTIHSTEQLLTDELTVITEKLNTLTNLKENVERTSPHRAGSNLTTNRRDTKSTFQTKILSCYTFSIQNR